MSGLERIAKQVAENPVIIYMKGSPQFPSCGFSSRASQALAACQQPFAYVNVLEDMEIYEDLPKFADWPTFPQVYIGGELIGGCDITLELFEAGELKTMMEQANSSAGIEAE